MSLLVEDFHKYYGETRAVAGLSFEVPPGTILGLVGPNGAGKTTTMRALAGIIAPTRGRLAIAGYDLVEEPIRAKAALAYIPDEPRLFDQLTIWEHLQFVAAAYRLTDWQPLADDLLRTFDLLEKRDSLCSELSRGMRQKVAICCGYLHQPKAIMLDEPLTGLDPYGIRTIKESIRRRAAEGAAIMISSHLLTLVEDLCSAVLILHRGQQVLHADMEALRRRMAEDGRHETLEEMFFRLTGPSEPLAEPAAEAQL
ncbi:MAG: ABC transporter ATP-binding protein [Gemmataceae bacterium]|nr:ABC transporter ATP-binding protein [Gemmataceae bacterium]